MTGRDDIILEYLAETGVALNKRGLEINLSSDGYDISYSTIKRRLPKLEAAELIEIADPSGPWYRITEKGERYLQGEADLRDEPEPNA
ncbi:ArsR family transcriptional regulator [Halomicrobium mukohataei]|uniref:ArsR family transcriptional regulator n=1 Tax=Halomicrobium mukohataei TaxID=57705 RepID=A0A847UGS1_9EURY|nr:winged-helix domain-containing protein [Halomicrobium mukohataei]NLV10694.1 ArsR family transcriptional regulator [Halomicrobium mukohataei]